MALTIMAVALAIMTTIGQDRIVVSCPAGIRRGKDLGNVIQKVRIVFRLVQRDIIGNSQDSNVSLFHQDGITVCMVFLSRWSGSNLIDTFLGGGVVSVREGVVVTISSQNYPGDVLGQQGRVSNLESDSDGEDDHLVYQNIDQVANENCSMGKVNVIINIFGQVG